MDPHVADWHHPSRPHPGDRDLARAWEHQIPFIQPVPYPEPPRVVYPRPLVASLSVAESDLGQTPLSAKCSPAFRQISRNPTIAHQALLTHAPLIDHRAAPQPSSPPQFLTSANKHRFRQLPQEVSGDRAVQKTSSSEKAPIASSREPPIAHDVLKTVDRNVKDFRKPPVRTFTRGFAKNLNHQVQTNPKSVAPDNLPKKDMHYPNGAQESSPTKRELLEVIRRQDAELQKISQRVDELLKLHQATAKSNANSNKMSTKETMTSIGLEGPYQRSPQTPCSPDPIHRRYMPLNENDDANFDESSEQGRFGSIEQQATSDMHFYDRLMANVNGILEFSGQVTAPEDASTSDIDNTRSSASVSSPQPIASKARREKPRVQFENHTASHRSTNSSPGQQTIIIEQLARKYAIVTSSGAGARQTSSRKSDPKPRRPHPATSSSSSVPFIAEASIATKNYLSKYGLFDGIHDSNKSPKNSKPTNTARRSKAPIGSEPSALPVDRILNINALKMLPKLT